MEAKETPPSTPPKGMAARPVAIHPWVQDEDLDQPQSQSPQAHWAEDSGGRPYLGLDVGGSLAKLVFFDSVDRPAPPQVLQFFMQSQTYGTTGKRHCDLEVHDEGIGGTLHFVQFETSSMERVIQMVKKNNLHEGLTQVYATGGGAHKYQAVFEQELGLSFVPKDELGTVIRGITFLVHHLSDECQKIEPHACPHGPHSGPHETAPPQHEEPTALQRTPSSSSLIFPFLLCNIGSGVSIVHVESPTVFKRVSGTALGGGTFLGLCRLLTAARSFDDAMDSVEDGDVGKVNMLVGDIYGGDLKKFNLSASLTASFFAKNIMLDEDTDPHEDLSDQDIIKTLCMMITQNITQIAHLNARLYGLHRVFFTGNFLRHNAIGARTIVSQMERWNELDTGRGGDEPIEALFFKHEGFLGAVGTMVQTKEARESMCEARRKTSGEW